MFKLVSITCPRPQECPEEFSYHRYVEFQKTCSKIEHNPSNNVNGLTAKLSA